MKDPIELSDEISRILGVSSVYYYGSNIYWIYSNSRKIALKIEPNTDSLTLEEMIMNRFNEMHRIQFEKYEESNIEWL